MRPLLTGMRGLPRGIWPRGIWAAFTAMVAVVTVSNVAVQVPINAWLTYGALSYPIAFLVTDLTNRAFGPDRARRVVYAGFAAAVVLSMVASTPRIAAASGAAFLLGQLTDVQLFHLLRKRVWWVPPLASSLTASALDTAAFFTLAFAGTGLPWPTWAVGDYGVKAGMALAMLVPFRVLLGRVHRLRPAASTSR
ncbi:queuosine precursor transporter [Limimonas halophila]